MRLDNPEHDRIEERAPTKRIRARHKGARIALIRAREEIGKSRPQLARQLRICRHYLFSVETGKRKPSYDLMTRWARALDKPLTIFGLGEDIVREERAHHLVDKIIRGGSPKALGSLESALAEIVAE